MKSSGWTARRLYEALRGEDEHGRREAIRELTRRKVVKLSRATSLLAAANADGIGDDSISPTPHLFPAGEALIRWIDLKSNFLEAFPDSPLDRYPDLVPDSLPSILLIDAPWHLRFELGSPYSVASDLRILQAVHRAMTIYRSFFLPDDDLIMLGISYGAPDLTLREGAGTFTAALLNRAMDRTVVERVPWTSEGGEENRFDLWYTPLRASELDMERLVQCIANTETGREPGIERMFVLANLTRTIGFHMYDDRGLLIRFRDREQLRPAYERLRGWIAPAHDQSLRHAMTTRAVAARYDSEDRALGCNPKGWIAALSHPDSKVRTRAACKLGDAQHLDAIRPLLSKLGDTHAEVRVCACWALGAVGGLPGDVLDGLQSSLRDPDPDVRREAIGVIWGHALSWESAGAAIRPCLDDPDAEVRLWAVAASGDVPNLDGCMQDALAERLEDVCPRVREAAVRALGKQPEISSAILEAIGAALSDGDAFVRGAAAEALCADDLGSTRPRRAGLLDASFQPVTEPKARGIPVGKTGIGPVGESTIGSLIAALLDAIPFVRERAACALSTQPELPAAALDPVLRAAADPANCVRAMAVRALHLFPERPEKTIPALRYAVREDNFAICRAALFSVKKFGPQASALLDDLIALIGSKKSALMEIDLFDGLAAIGPAAVRAAAPLASLLEHGQCRNPVFCVSILNALRKIGATRPDELRRLMALVLGRLRESLDIKDPLDATGEGIRNIGRAIEWIQDALERTEHGDRGQEPSGP